MAKIDNDSRSKLIEFWQSIFGDDYANALVSAVSDSTSTPLDPIPKPVVGRKPKKKEISIHSRFEILDL